MAHRWPWVLSGLIIVFAVLMFWCIPDMTGRSQLGDYLAGIASTIAFIWLIAAYLQQGNELRLQREELALQRISIDLQREELKRLGKFAALEQVSHLLEQFDLSLRSNSQSPVKSANDLPMAFINTLPLWKPILEASDTQAVYDSYMAWAKIEAPCNEFLSRIVSAVELYCEATGDVVFAIGTSPVEKVYFNYDKLLNIPFVRQYVGAAHQVATNMVLMEPGIDKMHLAGYGAMDKLFPGAVKAEALAELRAKVEAREASLKEENGKNA
ncbi:MAG: hypothetical protein PHC90_13310 [Syntrophorhabdaceae bacterium]|nr:hypothetical protein [Syntrophorhabdaceae bacterium]